MVEFERSSNSRRMESADEAFEHLAKKFEGSSHPIRARTNPTLRGGRVRRWNGFDIQCSPMSAVTPERAPSAHIIAGLLHVAVVAGSLSFLMLVLASGVGGSLGSSQRCEQARGSWEVNYPFGPVECVDPWVEPFEFDVQPRSRAQAQRAFIWIPLGIGAVTASRHWLRALRVIR